MTDRESEGALAPKGTWDRIARALLRPTDPAALAAFRFGFGVLGLVSSVRFLAYGWVDELLVDPRYVFPYWGMEWITPMSARGMHALFMGLAAASVCVALGLFYRAAIVLFFLGFSYVQLIDVANYLNHYYLVSLLAFLMAFMPLNRAYALDARLFPASRREALPAWCTHLLRFQVGVVYIFAGLAKAGSDWLLHAQPLNIWLSSRTHLPVIGPLLGERWAAYVMSWAGFLFDLTVVLLLAIPRTRLVAYAAVLVFHTATKVLFPIGMFPAIMTASALIFFSPSWPRKLLRAAGFAAADPDVTSQPTPLPRPWVLRAATGLAACYCAFQVLWPLRTHLYGGDVLWHEQGMRFSWRVMVREKNGSVTYLVTSALTGRTREVSPRKYLNDRQAREFSAQPDLILRLAHRIADDIEAREGARPVVRARALASLNGRPAELLIDPEVNLASVRDGLAKASFILPAPGTDPIHLKVAARGSR
jgi:hypothetical protein